MRHEHHEFLASVTYRANRIDGSLAEVRIKLEPRAATVADAWARLTANHPDIDPRSLEIEIRHAAACPVHLVVA